MNLLAHSYLSFNHAEILVGNMISDFVKGKKKFDYSTGIQQGITLHRHIDTYTDEHAATKEAKEFLRPAVGLYAGAFVDVVYDHFLANDANEFSDETLLSHTQKTYTTLKQSFGVLPLSMQQMLPYMTTQNWLYNYKTLQGTEKSFGGVVRRAKYLNDHQEVYNLFEKHYVPLQNCYNNFFPHVKDSSYHQFQQFLNL